MKDKKKNQTYNIPLDDSNDEPCLDDLTNKEKQKRNDRLKHKEKDREKYKRKRQEYAED